MNCIVAEVKNIGKVTDLEIPITDEHRELRKTRDLVVGLHRKHSVETLTKSLRKYQEASRTPHIGKDCLAHLLAQIQITKYMIEIMSGELL